MKKTLTTILLVLAASYTIFSQSEESTKSSPNIKYMVNLDAQPEYPGGMAALSKFISEQIQYPAEAINQKIEGSVVVSFVVKKDGTIANIRIAKSIHPLLDQEAIRITKSMPKWIPAQQNGKSTDCKASFPITFKL